MCFVRVIEEVLPFAYYLRTASRLMKRSQLPNLLNSDNFRSYKRLSVELLDKRLAEEHERATALDEKTLRVTIFVSAAFVVFGMVLTVVVNSNPQLIAATASVFGFPWLIAPFGLSLIYSVFATLTALGALRTYPRFAFGTAYQLARHTGSSASGELQADQLARQEVLNTLRHCRNEAVFQSLRNCLLLLVMGIGASLVLICPVDSMTERTGSSTEQSTP